MLEPLRTFLNGRTLLLAVAAESEARAVLAGLGSGALPRAWETSRPFPSLELLVTGVGKANAAGAVARALDPARHGAVLSVGIAGAYNALPIGSIVAASACVYGDEGVDTPDRFIELSEVGFPPSTLPGMQFPVPAQLLEVLRPFADVVGAIATVSTCSGTDQRARELAARTGAICEVMEGAAVAHAAHRLGVPAGELRVISNTTGDRRTQVWDIKRALTILTSVIGQVAGPGPGTVVDR